MRDLRSGDIIHCGGVTCEIKTVIDQEPWEWRNAHYLEFWDTNGNYRSWNQAIDGGYAELKED